MSTLIKHSSYIQADDTIIKTARNAIDKLGHWASYQEWAKTLHGALDSASYKWNLGIYIIDVYYSESEEGAFDKDGKLIVPQFEIKRNTTFNNFTFEFWRLPK